MKYNKFTSWIAATALTALSLGLISTPAYAEVIFEDRFDQPAEPTAVSLNASADSEWQIRKKELLGLASARVGGGLLDVHSEQNVFGGVSSSRSDNFDFFRRELTFTFSGFDLKPFGVGNPAYQWAKVGVFAGDGSLWHASSQFVIAFNATGQFSVQVRQPPQGAGRLQTLNVKDFRVPYFSFDIAELSKVQLVLDDTYFRILFVFGNELDQLSFGGEHGLDRTRWFFDTVGVLQAEQNLNTAQIILDNAIASGDQTAIAEAELNLQNRQEQYDAKLLEAEPLYGDTSILVAAGSNDARYLRNSEGHTEVGASLTLDYVRVETTNTLDVLRNPPL